ncbi:S-adenosyl-L-methionine-dependent methyltransferase [Podospora didyma]|uniref:S-adenosyl-L-methionine-dependent methyltransferase n=1 Tax=Podospora didyma TaxID=330526 RepID=A0AAE0U0A0_9PEZI|nr:S-adenosyl-L-methionine-dependent methyltransferase [Podospora didyma]
MGATSHGPAAQTEPAQSSAGDEPVDIFPAEHWAQQELPPRDDDDNDSSLGSDILSSTASLSASILEYRMIHGRTFHSDKTTDAQYWVPNDDKQNESMDINHHLLTLVLDGKLFRAPLDAEKIKKVIDIGTGTGLWAIDFADQYPDVEVIGTDLSPIQPTWVPPNLRFEIEDMTLNWTYRPNDFDFVHMRYLFGSVENWTALLRQAYRACKPGGWVESFEASTVMDSDDGSVKVGSPMTQWGKVFQAGGEKFGRTFRVVEDGIQKKAFDEAGFVNVTVWDFKCPLTTWPADRKLKEMGAFSQMALEQDIEGYVLFMWSEVMGWSTKEIHVYIAHLRNQIRDKSVHAFFRQRVVFGQKPEKQAAGTGESDT